MRSGAIVPHAPLLVPMAARRPPSPAVAAVRAAARAVARSSTRETVLISPHGSRSGIYVRSRGDLSGFGVPGAQAAWVTDEAVASELAERWQRPLLDQAPDHGIVVPVLLGPLAQPVVAVALAEGAAAEEAEDLAAALRGMDVDIVASVNTGAGITARAPLGELPEGLELEREVVAGLTRDAATLVDGGAALAARGGSCASAPLTVLGRLFAGVPGRVLAHEWPHGVGYLVATMRGEP